MKSKEWGGLLREQEIDRHSRETQKAYLGISSPRLLINSGFVPVLDKQTLETEEEKNNIFLERGKKTVRKRNNWKQKSPHI